MSTRTNKISSQKGITKEKILILFGADSSLGWGRSFKFAMAFQSLGCEVFYIDLPVGLLHTKITQNDAGKVTKKDGINCYRPFLGLPVGKMPFLEKVNHALLKKQIMYFLKKNNFSPSILWVYTPYQSSLAYSIKDLLQPKYVVYDCSDERIGMAYRERGEVTAKYVEQQELNILALANIVFTASDPLKQLKKKNNSNTHHLPNGINPVEFSSDLSWALPLEYQNLTGRIILYTGSIEYWLDLEAIKLAAQAYQNDSFVLVGPCKTNVEIISTLPNVHILGQRPHTEIGAYIFHSDICINPIRPTPVTNFSDSMKTLQYLCLGKPVVAIDYGNANSYNGFVELVKTSAEFVDKLGTIQSENVFTGRKVEWQNLLSNYSWVNLAQSALTKIVTHQRLKGNLL